MLWFRWSGFHFVFIFREYEELVFLTIRDVSLKNCSLFIELWDKSCRFESTGLCTLPGKYTTAYTHMHTHFSAGSQAH